MLVDENHVMEEKIAGSPWKGDAAAVTVAQMSVAVTDSVGDETILLAGSSASVAGSDWNLGPD